MHVNKGARIRVDHDSKGVFLAVAERDFDTGDDYYPVLLDQDRLENRQTGSVWHRGENVPLRPRFCWIAVLDKDQSVELL